MSEMEQQVKWVIEFQGDIPVLIETQQGEEETTDEEITDGSVVPNAAAKKRAKETLGKLQKAYQDFEEKQKLEYHGWEDMQKLDDQNQENVSIQKEALVEESYRLAKTLEDFYAMIREIVRFMKFFSPKKNNPSSD